MCGYRSREHLQPPLLLDGKHTDRADWEVEILETVLQIY